MLISYFNSSYNLLFNTLILIWCLKYSKLITSFKPVSLPRVFHQFINLMFKPVNFKIYFTFSRSHPATLFLPRARIWSPNLKGEKQIKKLSKSDFSWCIPETCHSCRATWSNERDKNSFSQGLNSQSNLSGSILA